jgi:signal transduction histidine kinase
VYGLTSLLLVAGLGLAVYGLTARYLEEQVNDELAALAGFYAVYTATMAPADADLAALAPQIAAFFAPQAGYDVRLFSARTGALLAASPNAAGNGPLPSSVALAALNYRGPGLFLAASQDLPGRRYAARTVSSADGTVRAVVEVSRDVTELSTFLRVLRLVLGGSAALALGVALAVSIGLARHVTRPLRQVEAVTHDIAHGDFSRRLAPGSEDEIGRLTASVNQMAGDLARLEASRRDFLARVSHDLRTPLTAIKGLVVNLQDSAPAETQPALATIDEQADRLIRLVDDLMLAARLQRGEIRMRRSPVDLAEVARQATVVAGHKASRLGVSLSLDAPGGPGERPPVSGDADRLQQVVLNLLDNALRAAPAGSAVRVSVGPSGEEVFLTVADDGPGVPAEVEGRAFEPYVRGPGGGAGLGLAIARDIVAAHGGRTWLRNRPEGGAEAGVALPALR